MPCIDNFGQWYRFDDDKVTLSTLTQVLQSADTYMCFYAKKHLEYKPHTVPSYIRSREAEMEKEMRERKEKDKAREKEVEDELLATI
jgi:ubiquitin carboxyl-terminal hydrolase 22/27/51